MKAVILAAGPSAPLQRQAEHRPKALLPVGGVPILRRAITNLLRCGFDQFVLCTGYREPMLREAIEDWFPQLDVTFVTNPEHATTNNAYSLWLARAHVDGAPFLLLDGDVVFDLEVIEELVERGPDSLAVRSVGALGLEEVKVTADNQDRVLAIGKHVPVRSAMGESLGIALFSPQMARRLIRALDHRVRDLGLVHEYYEAAFQQLVDEGATLYGVDIGTMYATEIDTLEDLRAANDRHAQRPAFDTSVADVRLAI